MADHVRQQIVAAAKARVTGLVTTGPNVFGFRVNALQAGELPGLCVYADGDAAEPTTIHSPLIYERTVEVHVVGYAARNDTLDVTLDLIAKEVETALAAALTVGSKAVEMVYRGCEKTLEAGEKQAGEIDMTFSAKIYNAANAPDVLS